MLALRIAVVVAAVILGITAAMNGNWLIASAMVFVLLGQVLSLRTDRRSQRNAAAEAE